MRVEWVDDPSAFTAPEWSDLVEADPDGTVFHRPRFLKLYWEEFGAAGLRVALVREGDTLLAVAPFDVRERTLTFLGGFDVTDYLGPVGLPAAREGAAKELMATLAAEGDWDRGDLRGLPQDGTWLRPLEAAGRDAGLVVETAEDGVAPWLDLPDSFDQYLAGLPGKLRHEIRRKERRLREALADARVVDATVATAAAGLDRFVDLHRSSPGDKGRFMVPGMELFFRRMADAMLTEGTLRLTFLEAEGMKIAGALGFRDRQTFRLYNSVYDHARAGLSPGMVLVAELIRSAIDEGCRGLDFLKGDLPYKYRFGARRRRVSRLLLSRP
jgi:CelD/BcsL family acetyltransferase involved in cellulose biosynthesis